MALALGGALLTGLAACGQESAPREPSWGAATWVEEGFLPELSPWREGEREDFPVSFVGGTDSSYGVTGLLELHADGTYLRAQNGCLARWHEDSGRWAFGGAGLVLGEGDPLPGARWLGALQLTREAGTLGETPDVLLVAKTADDEWRLVGQDGWSFSRTRPVPWTKRSRWNSVRVPGVEPLMTKSMESR